jgi:hypothetical protein
MKTAVEGNRLHRIRRAIATIDSQPLYGKDSTERAASAAAVLTKAIVGRPVEKNVSSRSGGIYSAGAR